MDIKLRKSIENKYNEFIARVESSPESLLSAGEYMLKYLGYNLVIKRKNSQTWQQLDNAFSAYLKDNDEIDYSTSTVYHYKLRDFLLMDEL